MSSNAMTRSGSSSAPRTLTSSTIGSVIEWYDFTIYGTAAALIFNQLFFSNVSPANGTLAAFGTFAAGFIARPLGGFVAGHYGDRVGRKATLVATLTMMGAATTLIGALPTYDQIGLWAPVLLVLCRLVQGFAVGGEWGGAVLVAVEHAPAHKRGLYGAWPQTGVSAGLLLGTGAFSLVSLLPEPALMAWGWRLPFLASVLLAVVGLYIRFRISESESFTQATARSGPTRRPLVEVLRRQPREILIAVFAPIAAFYAELFAPHIRYSGVSIGYQTGSVLLGGFTPLVASSLILWSGGESWSVAALIAAGAIVAAVAMLRAPETSRRSLLTHETPATAVRQTAATH